LPFLLLVIDNVPEFSNITADLQFLIYTAFNANQTNSGNNRFPSFRIPEPLRSDSPDDPLQFSPAGAEKQKRKPQPAAIWPGRQSRPSNEGVRF
jgi:hypothetical protein